MDLTALTLTQLFTRQAQLNADHERLLAARNGCAPYSFDWDLQNAALTSSMEDIADAAREITRRITAQLPARHDDRTDEILTHVPMVCTTCRQPVSRQPEQWVHVHFNDYLSCEMPDGTPVTAMVEAGNESVPRNA
jgi:hypothetical protein